MTRPESSETEAQSDAISDAPSGSLFRGVAKHSLIYGLGAVLARATSLIMLPVYTRYLSPADYGVMALIEMTLDFISIVGGSKLALGVFRFYHKTDDEAARREIASTAFLMIGALYCAIGVGVFWAAVPLSNVLFGQDVHANLIRVAAVNLSFSALLIVPMSLARVKDLSSFYVGASLVKLFLQLSLNVLFIVFMGLGVMGIFLGGLIANAVVGGFVSGWLLRTSGMRLSPLWTRSLLRYGMPLMASQVATFLATFSDRYFLQASANETAVGLYNLAYQFGFLLVMVGFTPMYYVWGPRRFQVAREEDRDELLARGFLISSLFLLTTAVGVSLYVGDVLVVMATPAFHPAARVVPLILVAYIFQSWANVLDIGILVCERTKYLAWSNWVSAAVAVGGYALLVPRYLEWGAASATVIAFATRFGLTYAFAQRLWPVRYEWTPVLILVAWSSIIAATGVLLPPMEVVLSLLVRTSLVLTFAVGLWWLPIGTRSDREAIVQFLKDGFKALRERGA